LNLNVLKQVLTLAEPSSVRIHIPQELRSSEARRGEEFGLGFRVLGFRV